MQTWQAPSVKTKKEAPKADEKLIIKLLRTSFFQVRKYRSKAWPRGLLDGLVSKGTNGSFPDRCPGQPKAQVPSGEMAMG